MSDMQNAIKELSTALSEIMLPKRFLKGYDQLECLAHSHATETYLVRQKGSHMLCIAKCYDRNFYKAVKESGILKTLRHEGLPAFVEEYEDDATVCIVREYIEGTPLDKYVAQHSLSQAQIVALCVELCDILCYLHEQEPPVIHRDIKPQNIIMKDNGKPALIDFDIARVYDSNAETDTQFIGTRTYAPPEQYGFSQTDCRADIYSLGVLLCFLLTGNTDVKNAKIPNKRLSVIVHRCAAFSPEERFSDAAAVKNALLSTDGRKQKKVVRACSFAAAALICLCAGFGLGRYTDFLTASAQAYGVRFAEPLMEQAVRVQLGKNRTEPITKEELLSVRELYIFGNEVSVSQDAFLEGLGGRLRDAPRGTIATLEDVKLMPNLEKLYVNYQTLSDISAIAELSYLTEVNFRHTFVEDISALSDMPHLRRVTLYDTHVTDMSALASCPMLDFLEAGETKIPSFDTLPASLETLSLKRASILSLNGIERFERLQTLYLSNTDLADLEPLTRAPQLREVYIDETMRDAAEALGDTAFEILYE
ncbi:MAG: protein kinase [Clostridiaceae bacterium]